MPQSTVPKVHVSPFMVVSLALDSVPLGDPWLQIKTGILLVGTIVLVVWVTRLTLWQRDEYGANAAGIPNIHNACESPLLRKRACSPQRPSSTPASLAHVIHDRQRIPQRFGGCSGLGNKNGKGLASLGL